MSDAGTLVRVVAESHALSAFIPALAQRLQKATGARVEVEIVPGNGDGGSALETLLALEKLVLRRARRCWSDRIDAADLTPLRAGAERPDIVIDLTANGAAASGGIRLRPLYDGQGGETALAGALFHSGTPQITILRTGGSGDGIVGEGVASLEDAAGIGGAMEAVWSRAAMMLVKALGALHGKPLRTAIDAVEFSPAITKGAVAKRSARMVAAAAARAAYRLSCHAPHWRVGWRFADAANDVWARRDLGGARWTVLADPVDHFYADPFPFHHQGKDYILFEDLDHKTGKGIISVVAFDEDGRPGPTVPMLEEPWHLSYPFLIEARGEIWMIPEASLSGAVSFYRAVEFPYRWERQGALLSGLEAADATIVAHGGLLHLFAVVREGVGGYSDALSIWHADDLFGVWTPHEGNPVLIDDRTARPAGNFVVRDGALMRPVQDCRNGYGAALALARVDRLDREHFEQTIETQLSPGPHWPGRKLHTLNGNGRLEVIDGSSIRPKSRLLMNAAERYFQP